MRMMPTMNRAAAMKLNAEVQKFSPAALKHQRQTRTILLLGGVGAAMPAISSSRTLICLAKACLLEKSERNVSAQLVAQDIHAANRNPGLCAPAGPTISFKKTNDTPNAPPERDIMALSISS